MQPLNYSDSNPNFLTCSPKIHLHLIGDSAGINRSKLMQTASAPPPKKKHAAAGGRRNLSACCVQTWEKRLSTLCLNQLGPLPEQADQHHLTAQKMTEFATLPAGLMIQFDPYDFGVGSDNDFHVMIPWSNLQDMLAPNGPARFVQPAHHETESRTVETACNTSPNQR